MTTSNFGPSPSSSVKASVEPNEAFQLAPFNPSSLEIQEKAMKLLKLNGEDVLFDLGCGDGRLLISAAKRHPGLRCVGIELDPIFSTRAQEAIQELPDVDLRNRVDIRLGDALQLSLKLSSMSRSPRRTTELTLMDDATALYLFILPKGIEKLIPLLETLVETRKEQRRSLRILSYMFKIHCWEPTTIDKTAKAGCPIYLYDFATK